MKLKTLYEVVAEKLRTIPTRDLVFNSATGFYAHENYLMSKVLEEVALFCSMIMRNMAIEN